MPADDADIRIQLVRIERAQQELRRMLVELLDRTWPSEPPKRAVARVATPDDGN